LTTQHLLLDSLKKIWTSVVFKSRYQSAPSSQRDGVLIKYREPVLIAKIFLLYVQTIPTDCEFLFQLQRIHQMRTLSQFGSVKFWFKHEMAAFYTIDQHKNIINRLVRSWNGRNSYDESLKSAIIENIIIPILNFNKENQTLGELIGTEFPINYQNEIRTNFKLGLE